MDEEFLHRIDKQLGLLVESVATLNSRLTKVEDWQRDFWRHFLLSLVAIVTCCSVLAGGLIWMIKAITH